MVSPISRTRSRGGRLRALLLSAALLTAPVLPRSSSARTSAAASAMDSAVRTTLPNGLRVVIVPDHLAPVVQTQIIYLAGSTAAPEGFPGTAHALEHMMFNGTSDVSREQLSTISARIGDNNNAFTTEDATQFYFQAPASNLGLLLRLEADRMRHAKIAPEEWAHERGAIEQEVSRDLSSPIERYLVRQNAILFAGTPYSHDALGTRESFEKTDATLLRRFYDSWYQPNNAILLIVGDVDPSLTLTQVKAQFGAIPAGHIPARMPVRLQPVTAQTVHLESDLGAGILTVAFQMPGAHDPDYAVAQILADVLASQRGALFALVPQGKALSTEFDYSPRAFAGSGLALAVFPKGEDPQKLLATLRGVLANIRAHGVSPELVEAARRKEIADLEFDANGISDLTQSWASTLSLTGAASPAALVDSFRHVTTEQVNAMAARVLDPAHALTGILTPTASPNPDAAQGKAAEKFISPPTKPVALPDWAQKELQTLSIPPAAPLPAAFTLANGLRLLVQPEHVSHTIKLYGRIRQNGDLEEPAGKEGVASLTAGLFLYGSHTHDRLHLAAALDALAADASAGPGFGMSALTPAFEPTLSLLADNELDPAFPAEAFETLKKQAIAGRPGVMQSPGYRFGRALQHAVNPPHDATLRETTPASLARISLQDVMAYYHHAYRPELTTIVVMGDITPEHARDLVAARFGGWKAEGPTPQVDLPGRPLSRPSHAVIADPGRVQDDVVLVESLDSGIHNPDRFALELGNEILGRGFASRLMQDLRVRTGYAYSANSSFQWSQNRGAFVISFGADPDKVGPAGTAAISDLRAMQTQPATQDEIDNAKALILRGIPMDRASFDDLAGEYLSLTAFGLPLNEQDLKAHAIYAMTPDAIRSAFRHWARPDALAQIVRGPNPR
ncbi:M16 family metallopeptidase [Brytella acorum]|uniref:Pitrilysin family protein n=1 Tax=Brytella acorum TaxID=2959299 RepID=A0AA35UJ89_9PROT|nr:pitrilysin family protein [Brytella acorum]CAI9121349.1 pitrilysin family protein [Brytella acorum]